jgi:hypothetical protein
MYRRSIALLVLCLGALLVIPALAQADTGNIIMPQNEPPTNADGWQAGTCLTDEPAPEVHCGPQTGGAFFKQAGGHPPIGFTNYIIRHGPITKAPTEPPSPIGEVPVTEIEPPAKNRDIKTLRVDLPPGLTVNPNATEKCSLADFLFEPAPGSFAPKCGEKAKVGEEEVTLVVTSGGTIEPEPIGLPGVFLPKGAIVPPTKSLGTKVAVYNLQPKAGEPALFGFVIAGKEPVFLETEVSWQSDFHEAFTIRLLGSQPPFETLVSRLVNFGAATGNGTYINNPTTCQDPNQYPHLYSTWFRAESFGEPNPVFPSASTPVEAQVAENSGGVKKMVQQEGCDKVPFDPGISVDPGTTSVDSPAPALVDTTLKYLTGAESPVQESHLRKAVVELPSGMGINPSGSNGLAACTDFQFGKGQRTYGNSCPASSRIGTATIDSPVLEKQLVGSIYVGEQKSSNPTSGEEFRILVEAKEQNEGIDVRLVGHVSANPATGQLTTTFNEQEVGPLAGTLPEGLPQAPFTSVKLRFDGSHSVLSSPPTCSVSETKGQMEPWARPGTTTPVTSKFTLSSIPGGGTCPQALAQRPFAPSYTAKTNSSKAGKYSPFKVTIGRNDGQQELKLVDVTLPKGLTGKLAGIPYCSASALAAAAASSGKAQQASASCPSKSQIGVTTTTSGTGNTPVSLAGKAYLAGPYKGAPLSMAIVTPAVSGPFDLGTVVVRVALNVDPLTAQINAVSDEIPDVFGGVKLDIRSIVVNVNRKKFMLNPTNCSSQSTKGTIAGGGADPANSAAWSSYAVKAPLKVTKCKSLGFKPKLHTRIKGPTTRAKFPQIRAVLEMPSGNANVARTSLNLPHSLFLEQGHIRTVCTRPKLAEHKCPKSSIYGHAKAITPLLSKPLKGPVYMVPAGHELPDLVADLRGQVNIQLHGVISSKHAGLKTVFNNVPDVAVTKFILNMEGGKKSLLVNSTNLCKGKQRAVLNIKGQNGKRVKNNRYPLNIAGCGGKKKK